MKKLILVMCILATGCAELKNAVVFTDETKGQKQLQQRAFYEPLNSATAKQESVGSPIEALIVETKGARIKINGKSYMDQSGAVIEEIAAYSETGFITYIRNETVQGYSKFNVLLLKLKNIISNSSFCKIPENKSKILSCS